MRATGDERDAHHTVAGRFPLLPRTRPPCQPLCHRIDEIRALASAATHGPDDARLSSAAEAHNKAALIASDCGLPELARQLCWRQFDHYLAATHLTTSAAKLALQPIINLARLAIREGDGERAYRILVNTYTAATTPVATNIDGRDINFRRLFNDTGQHRELRTFLWSVLLADGTRALVRMGRWSDALHHVQHHKGIGTRMLDGRQVAIIAAATTGDCAAALALLDESAPSEPWEHAVAACLRTLCLRLDNRAATISATTMVEAYLQLEPSPEHLLFRSRLGLCILDLAAGAHQVDVSEVTARVIREAVVRADASSASDVLAHELCRSSMTETDENTLVNIIEGAGFGYGAISTELLDELMTATKASEEQLAQVLAPDEP